VISDLVQVQNRFLVVVLGDEEVRVPLTAALTRIGRGMSADVRIDDATVSRRHAIVAQREHGAVLLDDRSMNGTWLNGERVTEHPLADGDVIQLGAVQLRYHDVPAAPSAS
jgi:pSer/pThr/pTyr-binding forkhead associated (FHA) protein